MKNAWVWVVIVAVIVVGAALYVQQQQQPTPQPAKQTETAPTTPTTQPPATTGETSTTQGTTSETTSEPASETTSNTETTTTETTTVPPETTTPAEPAAATIKDPNTLVYATISDIDTLDPHYIYDTASGEVIFHVYDNLIDYDGPHTDRFVPMLSTEVPSLDNGLIEENPDGSITMRFPIRTGVKFHNGDTLTPEDVAYSFHRLLLFDRAAGPSWLVLSPVLGVNAIVDLARQIEAELGNPVTQDTALGDLSAAALEATCQRVKQAVQVEEGSVEFYLPQAFPPFLSIISHSASWAAILDKKWVAEQGDWDGDCASWAPHHDPEKQNDPLYAVANGTGPFKFEHWDPASQEVTMVRNDAYWQAPAKLQRVVIKGVDEWSTRKLMLQSGDADIAFVDRQFIDQVNGTPGLRVVSNLPQMALNYVLFNQHFKAEGNAYNGSGQLDGQGIPPDFFSDIDVRKGFNYLFDWETYIEQVLKGEGVQPSGPIPAGVPFENPDNPTYHFDLEKAAEHFQKAWGGQVWEKGFKFTALYNSGAESRKATLEILRRNLQRVNDKFTLEVVNVEWPTFLSKTVEGVVPMYVAAWLEDYHDAHNWIFTLMDSQGSYGERIGLGTKYDALVEQAVAEFDPAKRQALYYQLQQLAYDDAIAIFVEQRLGRQYMRTWVDGYYFNPIWPGRNFYAMSKKSDGVPNAAYIEALNLNVEQW